MQGAAPRFDHQGTEPDRGCGRRGALEGDQWNNPKTKRQRWNIGGEGREGTPTGLAATQLPSGNVRWESIEAGCVTE